MTSNPNHATRPAPAASGTQQGLAWNIDLTLLDDANQAAAQRRQAIDQVRANRPRTAHIEREIMIAVIVLYALILGSFASLHLYGEYALPPQQTQDEAMSTGAAS